MEKPKSDFHCSKCNKYFSCMSYFYCKFCSRHVDDCVCYTKCNKCKLILRWCYCHMRCRICMKTNCKCNQIYYNMTECDNHY